MGACSVVPPVGLCLCFALSQLGKQNVLPTVGVLGGQSRQRGHGHEMLHPLPCSEAAVARFVPLWGFHSSASSWQFPPVPTDIAAERRGYPELPRPLLCRDSCKAARVPVYLGTYWSFALRERLFWSLSPSYSQAATVLAPPPCSWQPELLGCAEEARGRAGSSRTPPFWSAPPSPRGPGRLQKLHLEKQKSPEGCWRRGHEARRVLSRAGAGHITCCFPSCPAWMS